MRKKQFISAIFFVLSGFFAQAAEGGPNDEEKSGDLKSEIKAYIRHHLEAVSYTHLTLPTILLV